MRKIDIVELRRVILAELSSRCCEQQIFSYSQRRGGAEDLYGITGAVNVLDALGQSLGDHLSRARIAARILAWRDEHGWFNGGSGPGHALHMIVGALNILGQPVPDELGPLAPVDPAKLPDWLDRLDWQSTHKELCGQTIPLLASGLVGHEWQDKLVACIAARLDPESPLETWCAADAPAWRVISCIFHVLSVFDAGRLVYPRPGWLFRRLLELHWEEVDDNELRTFCTDGDWAVLLLQLGRQLPHEASTVYRLIRRVAARRVREWHERRETIVEASTHDLYCYLWSTAVFQSCMRDYFIGGYLRDTFNDPALFRLGSTHVPA